MFADDTKLMLDVIESSHSLLQNDFHAVYKWCNHWKLNLNLDKCQLVRFSNGQSHNIFPYQINNNPIPDSRMYFDLGIHINDSSHLTSTTSPSAPKLTNDYTLSAAPSIYTMRPCKLRSKFTYRSLGHT